MVRIVVTWYVEQRHDRRRSVNSDGGQDVRPIFSVPGWDGKLLLAAMFFLGYYVLVWRISQHDIPPANVQLIRDQLLVLGPGVGLILGAIYRTTGAEERKAATDATVLKTAIETPTVVTAAGDELGDQVQDGAREGTRAGVTEALGVSAPAAAYSGPDWPGIPADSDAPANIPGVEP